MRKWVKAVICAALLISLLPVPARAEETAEARQIPGKDVVESTTGVRNLGWLIDGRKIDFVKLPEGATITLRHEEGIGSLYLIFGWEYGSYTVTDESTGKILEAGSDGILHEFLDLEGAFGYAPERVTIAFENGEAHISEIYAFTSGQTPDFVQKWEPPAEGCADLVLFSTHGDDEQLFFAGMIPYYAQELGCQVQVVYMSDHRNMTLRRVGEMLDGLWAVGLRNYPVFGYFGDYLTASRQETYQRYRAKGFSQEDIEAFVVENVRRFRPKAAVGHDLNGEYGHGMHMVYADALCVAAEASGDAERYPESAEKYGTWEIPKVYLHLYPENPVIMDWDQPLQSFGGMTGYEVTRDLGFPCHLSQRDYYSWYFNGKPTAASITEYSPREFGLCHSLVGQDVQKNDFLENVTTHARDAELARQEAEAATEPEQTVPQTYTAETLPQITSQPAHPPREEPAGERSFPAAAMAVSAAFGIIALAAVLGMLRKRKNK